MPILVVVLALLLLSTSRLRGINGLCTGAPEEQYFSAIGPPVSTRDSQTPFGSTDAALNANGVPVPPVEVSTRPGVGVHGESPQVSGGRC